MVYTSPHKSHKLKKQITVITGTIAGTLFTFYVLGMLNSKIKHVEAKIVSKLSGLKIENVAQKKQDNSRLKEQKPQKTVAKKNTNTQALPSISSNLSGLDFGLESQQNLLGSDASEQLLKQAESAIMTAETVDVPPVVESRPSLEYPSQARSQGIQGFVKINILLDKNGMVQKTQVIESEPPGTFDAVALASVKQWKFQPAKYQGESVQVWSQQMIRFDLN